MRILKYALKNIIRAPFLTISALVIIVLLVFFVHTLFLVRHATMILVTNIVERVPISLYLKPGYDSDNSEVQALMKKIKEVSPTIGVIFRSKEDALEALRKKDPNLASIVLRVDMTQENTIPNSILIEHISISEYERVNNVVVASKSLLQSDSLQMFSDYEYQYGKIQRLIDLIAWILYAIYIVIAFFLFSISVIIFHTIGGSVNHFREEIHIAQLVGAPRMYVS
jgi:cell division protein FtsX